ncbi:MAG: c-type cytochrome [Deltaproteobacteria bacterium]|nr:c-type cytochrome [Deltaproteobacteria bacterium]
MRTAATSPTSILVAVVVITAASACVAPTETIPRAAAHWAQCSPCHGDVGQGDPLQRAPSIAGLPVWYVDTQLIKFRAGVRGAHFDDAAGLRMRPMALSLHSDDDVKNMSAYVAQLAMSPSKPSIAGDTAAGKTAFATCAACHGADGGGNEALNAPPIAGRDDWYIYDQLKKFRSGIRGTNPKDVVGPGMRAIALSLADDKALQDVARYIAELPPVVSVSPKLAPTDRTMPPDIETAIKGVGTETKRP